MAKKFCTVLFSEYIFHFSEEKNRKLKSERGINFDDVINILEQGLELDIIDHHNQNRYCGQKILIIEKDNYVYAVPFLKDEWNVFFKTIYPSRKLHKKFLNKKS